MIWWVPSVLPRPPWILCSGSVCSPLGSVWFVPTSVHLGLTLEGGFWVITALGWKVQTLRSAWGFPSACNGSWPMAGAGISKPCSLATSIQIQIINYTRVFFHQLLLEYVSSHNILFCPILNSHFLTRFFWEYILRKICCADIVISESTSGKSKLRQVMTPPIT